MQGMIIDFDYVKFIQINYIVLQRIGKLTSLFVHTLSSFASDDEPVDEYAPSDSSFAYNGISSYAVISTEGLVDLNLKAQMPQTIPEDSEPLNIDTEINRIKNEIPKEMDESEEFNNVIGHENRIRWLERKVIICLT